MSATATLFVSRVLEVEKGWIDYNGHMNMAYYNVLFDRCSDEAFEKAKGKKIRINTKARI